MKENTPREKPYAVHRHHYNPSMPKRWLLLFALLCLVPALSGAEEAVKGKVPKEGCFAPALRAMGVSLHLPGVGRPIPSVRKENIGSTPWNVCGLVEVLEMEKAPVGAYMAMVYEGGDPGRRQMLTEKRLLNAFWATPKDDQTEELINEPFTLADVEGLHLKFQHKGTGGTMEFRILFFPDQGRMFMVGCGSQYPEVVEEMHCAKFFGGMASTEEKEDNTQ